LATQNPQVWQNATSIIMSLAPCAC
jgi:hypothetical protein